MKENASNPKVTGKRWLKILLWSAGILIALMVIMQVILSPAVTGRIINRIAEEYVDGKVSVGKARISLFKRFPKATVTIDDFSLTYPAERYDSLEMTGAQGHLAAKGRGAEQDTLASFKSFSVSLNLLSLISGDINISYADLVRPRIFIHRYSDGRMNVETLMLPQDTTEESLGLPSIRLGRVTLKEHPHIVYTDSRDTIFAMADLKQVHSRNRRFRMDSLIVAGRIAGDTLALRLNHLGIHKHQDILFTNMYANALLATRATGRMHIPIEISCGIGFPEDSLTALSITGFKADIASIPMTGQADLRLGNGKAGIVADLSIKDCKAEDVLHGFLGKYIPMASEFETDATLNLSASCEGDYIFSTGTLPEIEVRLDIPESVVRHKDIDNELVFRLSAEAGNSGNGRLKTEVTDLMIRYDGMEIEASGQTRDILEDDLLLEIDGRLYADLAKVSNILPDTLGINAKGRIDAQLKGSIRPSQIDIYRFSEAQLNGEAIGDSITVQIPKDSIDIRLGRTVIAMGPQERQSRRDSSLTFKMMGIKADINDADISLADIHLAGKDVTFSAMNSSDRKDTSEIKHLGGRIGATSLLLTDSEGTSIELKKTSNGFQMIPKRDNPQVPVLTVTSDNGQIVFKDNINRVILTDAEVHGSAAMNTLERRQKAAAFRDSLAKIYPLVDKDSLLVHHRRQMMARRESSPLPEWLKEEDFRKKDIDIRLDESLAKYFREWDLNGRIDVRTGIFMTPYFPLRNILRGFEMEFANDKIVIDSLKVMTGASLIGAKGSLTGLKRALVGRGGLNLDLAFKADKMDGKELYKAFQSGSAYSPDAAAEGAEISNAEFFKMVTTDTVSVHDSIRPIIVVPSNLNADIRIDASDISFGELMISSLSSNIKMKERCLQISESRALSNVGTVSLDGFYATRSKENIKAGFSLDMKDVTAEKIINMMPAIDTIMPLLNDFSGNLNCEISATASLDTNMRFIMPSINGIIRIGGKNLSVKDSPAYAELAKKLMFKNKKEGHIEEMSVSGLIEDNSMEIFPFLMKMDRYTLAMSGIHNMNNSFRYHASLIRSPFIIKLGIDLFGDSLDEMDFKIGKAKYRNSDIPDFTNVVDDTRNALLQSIRGIFDKGVEAAIQENERQEAITDLKQRIGYVKAVDQELEELNAREQKQLDTEKAILLETEQAEKNLSEAVENLLKQNNIQ